jgi:hypothetical protein
MLSSRIPRRTDRTHVEDLKDPDQILLPARNLVLVVLSENESEGRAPFTPLDDLPLHLYQGPAIETSVSGSLSVPITGLAHAFRFPIASRTDWLTSSDRLPFNLW